MDTKEEVGGCDVHLLVEQRRNEPRFGELSGRGVHFVQVAQLHEIQLGGFATGGGDSEYVRVLCQPLGRTVASRHVVVPRAVLLIPVVHAEGQDDVFRTDGGLVFCQHLVGVGPRRARVHVHVPAVWYVRDGLEIGVGQDERGGSGSDSD